MNTSDEECCLPSPTTSIESLEWDALSEPITDEFPDEVNCAKERNWKEHIVEMHTWLKNHEQLAYNGLDCLSGWEENYLAMKAEENKVFYTMRLL